jgi:hypothetical protein
MSHLRFSPDEYRTICQLARSIPLGETTVTALRHFLVAYLPLDHLDLAMRIDRLDNRRMRLLYEHLMSHNPAGATQSEWDAFTQAELNAVADAWGSFPYPLRFVRHFRKPLVHLVSDGFPELAQKLAGLSERQFRLLYEYVTRRMEGSA